MLDKELIAPKRHDRGRDEPKPDRSSNASDRCVEQHRHRQPHEVLHHDHEQKVRRERVEGHQKHAVADRPDRIGPHALEGVLEIDPAVGVAGDRWLPDQREVEPGSEAEDQ